MYMNLLKNITVALALSSSMSAFPKVVQIIHTNDLHSYFQGTRGGIGGYAQLKTKVDELKNEARAQGIPTLYLDAGDFGEGSSFYFSHQGVDSLRALDRLGVDVSVLGNHDFILGGRELSRQIKKAELKTKILSANLIGKRFMGLNSFMPDHLDFEFDGTKIRVFGLTTNEIHYMYPLRPLGLISNPFNASRKQEAKAKKASIDYTIALTHIGLEKDIELVEKSTNLDLVVGGHSHILLSRPQYIENSLGKEIPVVQAGAHSGYLGKMILDIQPGGMSKIIDYKMISIKKTMPQDEEMKKFVDEAYSKREQYFGRSWDEVIGFSNITLSGNFNGQETQTRTCWSKHLARLTRTVAKTEIGLQFDVFQGEEISAGPITFGDLVDNFPHFRAWGDKGWGISKARVSGFLLKKIIDTMASSEVALQVMIDGLDSDENGRFELTRNTSRDAKINGEPIHNLRFYTLALPSEVPFGSLRMVNALGLLVFQDLRKVKGAHYWPLIEEYVKKNSPLECLND
jgi:5'-nucleotidase/UDP-sugar diphosphatase